MESRDGEIGIPLDASIQERIGAYGAPESMTPGGTLLPCTSVYAWARRR
jgi:hypothetical protein